MKTCSIIVRGMLNESLQYDFGRIEKINQGTWQLCLATLAVHLVKKPKDPTKKPPTVQKSIDEFCHVYCNYVGGPQTQSTNTVIKPYCLSQLYIKLNVGQKKLLTFKARDHFYVNNPTAKFELMITDQHGEPIQEDIAKYLAVSVHILFKRTS